MPFIRPLTPDFSPPPGSVIKQGTPAHSPIINYTLKFQSNGFRLYYYPTHRRPPNAKDDGYKKKDHALDMRVYEDCQIRLTLDGDRQQAPNWRFPIIDDVITLGDPGGGIKPQDRFRNLAYLDRVDQKTCMTLAFDVDHHEELASPVPGLGHWKKHVYPFNVTIYMAQTMADGATQDAQMLALVIDPGIKNPGDDP
jgi:hypothetical protein